MSESNLKHITENLVKLIDSRETEVFPEKILDLLRKENMVIVTAESCTGGLVAKLLTDVAGSSDVFWGGFVTYSNQSKMKLLGVMETTLTSCGAVSEETVREMTAGALEASGADIATAVSGVAGPGGGSEAKPVGAVWIGIHVKGRECRTLKLSLAGSRERIRISSAYAVLLLTKAVLEENERIDTKTLNEYI